MKTYTDNLAGLLNFLTDNDIFLDTDFNPKTSEDDYMLVEGLKDIFSDNVVSLFLSIIVK